MRSEHLLYRFPRCQLLKNELYGNAAPSNDRFAHHDRWICLDQFFSHSFYLRIGSRWIPGSYESKSSSKAPSNTLPRRLTLCTNSKKAKYSGKWSCEIPRCGRSHERSRDQKPSIVFTCTS